MTSCPSRLPWVVRSLSYALLLTSVMIPTATFARDASLPYRNFPGFQCHQWNRSGECSDWSYFDPGVNPSATISVRATGSPNPVMRGDVLSYSIYLRNDDWQAHSIAVQAFPDRNTAFESATGGGYSNGTTIRWDNQMIAAKSGRTVILRVRVRDTASVSSPVVLTVQADGSADAVTTDVIEGGNFYANSMRFTYDGVYVPSGHPRTYRRVDYYTPRFYYDSGNNLHYRNTYGNNVYSYGNSSYYSNGWSTDGSYYSCDPGRFVCR